MHHAFALIGSEADLTSGLDPGNPELNSGGRSRSIWSRSRESDPKSGLDPGKSGSVQRDRDLVAGITGDLISIRADLAENGVAENGVVDHGRFQLPLP